MQKQLQNPALAGEKHESTFLYLTRLRFAHHVFAGTRSGGRQYTGAETFIQSHETGSGPGMNPVGETHCDT